MKFARAIEHMQKALDALNVHCTLVCAGCALQDRRDCVKARIEKDLRQLKTAARGMGEEKDESEAID